MDLIGTPVDTSYLPTAIIIVAVIAGIYYLWSKPSQPVVLPTTSEFRGSRVQHDLASQALEKDIFSSHQEFVKDSTNWSTAAGRNVTLDHDVDINPRWGLRRTNYSAIYKNPYESQVSSLEANELAPTGESPWSYL
jgi:hypothetical protein